MTAARHRRGGKIERRIFFFLSHCASVRMGFGVPSRPYPALWRQPASGRCGCACFWPRTCTGPDRCFDGCFRCVGCRSPLAGACWLAVWRHLGEMKIKWGLWNDFKRNEKGPGVHFGLSSWVFWYLSSLVFKHVSLKAPKCFKVVLHLCKWLWSHFCGLRVILKPFLDYRGGFTNTKRISMASRALKRLQRRVSG